LFWQVYIWGSLFFLCTATLSAWGVFRIWIRDHDPARALFKFVFLLYFGISFVQINWSMDHAQQHVQMGVEYAFFLSFMNDVIHRTSGGRREQMRDDGHLNVFLTVIFCLLIL